MISLQQRILTHCLLILTFKLKKVIYKDNLCRIRHKLCYKGAGELNDFKKL
jgi:hypothetical protein